MTPPPIVEPPRRVGPRLATRIVLLFLLLLLLVQGAGFVVMQQGIQDNARAQLRTELELGRRVLERLLAQNRERLMQGATLLAADFGFREALATSEVETIRSVLENHGNRIGALVTALLDTRGAVQAVAGAEDASLGAALGDLRVPVAGHRSASQTSLAIVGGQAYQFVMVPMRAPVVVGWVVMGFPLDQVMLKDLESLSNAQAAVVVRGTDRHPGVQLALSTLPAPQQAALQAWLEERAGALQAAAAAGTAAREQELDLDGSTVLTTSVPLVFDGLEVRAEVLLLQSVDKVLAPYRHQQWQLAGVTLAGVLVFGLGSLFTARRVTTPLRALVRASARMGAGDYAQRVDHTERGDEIGELARAFDTMRNDIALHGAEVQRLAYWDRLTGLPNRAQFIDVLRSTIAREPRPGTGEAALAVLLLDLARLKHVNDVLGYDVGDRLLQMVAQRLSQENVHGGDLVARVGGDDFAVLLPRSAAGRAEAVAQCIATALEAPMQLDEHRIDLSATVGVAVWPADGDNADTLLGRAELAMLSAKRRGLVTVAYDPSIDTGSAQTLSLLGDLKRAVECGELRLYLQPKIGLATGAAVGAEALVRWQAPGRGLVPPMEFIPFAEQTGFIRQLTLWVFEQGCRTWPALQAAGLQRLSLNLSTRDLLDPELPNKLDGLRHRHGTPAQALCLEITESAIMDDPQRAQATLEQLHARGYKLSIDDFGTGYSSLAYLKRLPVTELKIDKSFVLAMERDSGDAKIVRSTIDLAHNLGLSVVAEGVENAAIYEALRALGCDEAQGFHMGRPMPLADFIAWADRWRNTAASPVEAPPSVSSDALPA